MGFQDIMSYVPLSGLVSSGAASLASATLSGARTVGNLAGLVQKSEVKMAPPAPLWKLAAAAGPYVRLAAISGAAAVILGAYGSHKKYPKESTDQKQIFETASRYHFFHTLALLGLPLCRSPFPAAVLFMSGLIMFCGSCYYCAFTGDRRFSTVTPFGGVCFILGWLAMCI